MKNNLISEEEKNRILNLYEFYSKNMVGTKLINEAETIVTDRGGDWDYKESGNKYYARRKGADNWILATGNAERAIKKDIFNRAVEKVDVGKSLFKSQTQGNLFRKFVNNYYKNIAKKYNLDLVGPFNNANIINSANEIVTSKKYGKIKLGDLFFKMNQNVKKKGEEPGFILPSLVDTGFSINRSNWSDDLGYYVDKCTQEGCAQYTSDMLNRPIGDAWQAYVVSQQGQGNKYVQVTPDLISKMTKTFNNINKSGSPSLNTQSGSDTSAKNIVKSLIPDNQSQFNSLPLGTPVGLYYPPSENFDLAFFQSAIGKSRNNDKWLPVHTPFFCKAPEFRKKGETCGTTLWKPEDLKKPINFVPTSILKSGKAFTPNTHIGFIGYIDDKGQRYVVHNVHKTVYAFPVSKMNKNTLSIVCAGESKIS